VLAADPPWASLPAATPAAIRRLLHRCLEKDTKRRLKDIGDARLEIEDAMRGPEPAPVSAQRRHALVPALVGVGALIAGAFIASSVWMPTPEDSRPIRRFAIVLPEGTQFSATSRHVVAVSPDGTHLVYVANQRLYLRKLDQLDASPIRGTEEGGPEGYARSPFFSPDGQWIGFWQGGHLKKVSVNGGAPIVLCAAEIPFGASWGADGTILFGQGSQGIFQVSEGGGEPSVLVTVDSKTESAHGPQTLRGGEVVLFTLASLPAVAALTAVDEAALWDNAQIVVQSRDSGQRTVIVQGGADARYLSTGHLIYVRQGTLFAVQFDPARLVTTGSAFPVGEGIRQAVNAGVGGLPGGAALNSTGASQFTVSEAGLFVYVPQDTAGSAVSAARTLAWVDRQGRETLLPVPDRAYVYPRISPDGSRVALDIRDQEQDIWVWHLGRETLTRFTFDPAVDFLPVWTPDGERIVFSVAAQGLYWQAADGTGAAERLNESTANPTATAFSRDGTRLLFDETSAVYPRSIKTLSLDGRRTVDLLAQPMVSLRNGDISPDGRWLAYQSNESGQSEIYVRPFPDVQGGRWQVSRAGGSRPIWARSGRELFYLAPPATQPVAGGVASGVAVMAVPIESGPGFRAGNPARLFAGPYFAELNPRTYDVSADSQRFLMIKDKKSGPSASNRIIVVENFFEELKRLVPTN
jgi:serine/threonine-protein kinase